MNQVEAFFNWSNDLHWGPFEFLRPAKKAVLNGRLCSVICVLGAVSILFGINSLVLAAWVGGFGYNNHHFPSGPEIKAKAKYFARDTWWWCVGSMSAFVLLWGGCILAWNRRAARLRLPMPARLEPDASGETWPPPPRRSKRYGE